jgi:pyruvate dehydrogenase phosphatase
LLLGLGDVPFKQPPEFTRRILYNLFPGFHNVSPWEEFLVRNITPPYITAEPDVVHRRLDDYLGSNTEASGKKKLFPRFLVLVSDGFSDLCGSQEMQARILEKWATSVVAGPSLSPESLLSRKKGSEANALARASGNLALSLLRHALGEDAISVSKVLTLDMETAWIDDTALVVQML